MAINPGEITTVKVGELVPEIWSLSDLLPHEVESVLRQGSVQGLADLIYSYIGTVSSLAFNPATVNDGETLPVTTTTEWMFVGKGTFLNVGGGADIITTEELNVLTSNGSFWSLAVQIPIDVEFAGVVQTIRSGFTQTVPSENAVYNALILKANTSDLNSNNILNNSDVDGATVTDALNILNPTEIVTEANFLSTVEADGSIAKIDPVNLGFALDSNVIHTTGNETKTGTLILDNLGLANNSVGSTSNYLSQTIGGTDSWKIYGKSDVLDKSEMVFELSDNGGPFDSGGEKFSFKYNCLVPADSRTAFEIDYKTMMFNTGSGLTADPAVQLDGTIRLSNISSGMAPTLSGKSNTAQGLTIQAATFDAAALDMLFDVRTGANGDFTTLTNTAYRFRRFGTTLLNILRNGIVQIPNLSGTGTRQVVADASGNLSTSGTIPLKNIILFSQSGTSAPAVTVLDNTLGGTIVWTRTSIGQYAGTLSGAFTTNKTFILFQMQSGAGGSTYTSSINSSTNIVNMFTYINGVLSDGISGYMEIRVYP